MYHISKKYYSQILLEECKYEMKKTKMDILINDDLDLGSSDDKTDNESDNETKFDHNDQFVEIYNSILIAIKA